jgi:hypothetical protein
MKFRYFQNWLFYAILKTAFLYSDFNKVVVVAIDLMMMTTMMTMRAGGKEMDCYFHAVEPGQAKRSSAAQPSAHLNWSAL